MRKLTNTYRSPVAPNTWAAAYRPPSQSKPGGVSSPTQGYQPPAVGIQRPGASQPMGPMTGQAYRPPSMLNAGFNKPSTSDQFLNYAFPDKRDPRRLLAESYQTAMDDANAANEQRYQDILSGRLELRDRNMDRIESLGGQQIKDAQDYFARRHADNNQNLASRGLSASTVLTSTGNSIDMERNDALRRIQDDLVRQRISADASLTDGALSFMERREDEHPDYGQLAALSQMLGQNYLPPMSPYNQRPAQGYVPPNKRAPSRGGGGYVAPRNNPNRVPNRDAFSGQPRRGKHGELLDWEGNGPMMGFSMAGGYRAPSRPGYAPMGGGGRPSGPREYAAPGSNQRWNYEQMQRARRAEMRKQTPRTLAEIDAAQSYANQYQYYA